MGAVDWVLLALIGTYALFAVRYCKRRKSACGGDCGACRGCGQAK